MQNPIFKCRQSSLFSRYHVSVLPISRKGCVEFSLIFLDLELSFNFSILFTAVNNSSSKQNQKNVTHTFEDIGN